MSRNLYVFKDHAYRGKHALRSMAHVKPRKASRLKSLDLNPKLVFQVSDSGFSALATDPVDVRVLTAGRPGASVKVMTVAG